MLSVKVLGPGCANCERLEELTHKAVEQLRVEYPGLDATLEKISAPERFLEYGVLTTPGLVVNEKLVSTGKVPTEAQIVAWLRESLTTS